jgi:hypothetical protein
MRILYTVIPLVISIGMALFAIQVSIDARVYVDENFGKGRYKSERRTDEQAAVEFVSEDPVFPSLTEEQIARRALLSLCAQIQCSQPSDYVYSFGRDGPGAAGAFWYRPQNRQKADMSRSQEHFLCRFRNENWVFCYISTNKSRDIHMIYARTIREFEMKGRDLDRTVVMRKI